jgi:hypothetical protein
MPGIPLPSPISARQLVQLHLRAPWPNLPCFHPAILPIPRPLSPVFGLLHRPPSIVNRLFSTFKRSDVQTACPERSEGFKRLHPPTFNRWHLILEKMKIQKTIEEQILTTFRLSPVPRLRSVSQPSIVRRPPSMVRRQPSIFNLPNLQPPREARHLCTLSSSPSQVPTC